MNGNFYLTMAASLLLVGAIFALASTSVGVECYNKHESFKEEKRRNFDFLILNIVCNIFLIIAAIVSMYMSFSRGQSGSSYSSSYMR